MSCQSLLSSVPERAAIRASKSLRLLEVTIAALIVILFYGFNCSRNFENAYAEAKGIQSGDLQGLCEFRHLIYPWFAFWARNALAHLNIWLSPLAALRLIDYVSATAAILVLFAMLRRLKISRVVAFAATFFFATCWSFWWFVGTGKSYSSSELFIIGAYCVALSLNETSDSRSLVLRTTGAAMLAVLSNLFWLQQAFNCIGVGLLVALRPERLSWKRRAGYLGLYALTGLIVTLAIALSAFRYSGIVHSTHDLGPWISSSGTPPLEFSSRTLMAASLGHASAIIYLDGLQYMVNGLVRGDARLLQIGFLPWQLGKYIFAWLLLAAIYLYPLLAFSRAFRQKRVVLLSFGVALLPNLAFALLWLGEAPARFLPSLLSLVVFGAMALEDALGRLRLRRYLAASVGIGLLLIAAVNLVEGIHPMQIYYSALTQRMEKADGKGGPKDLVLTFGRDFTETYHMMLRYYFGPGSCQSLTNDGFTYNWDRADWQQELVRMARERTEGGGHVFIDERLARGLNPVSAAWSEVQHPRPTIREVSEFFRSNFCLEPAWHIGSAEYWRLDAPSAHCSSPLAASRQEKGRKTLPVSQTIRER
jgi:hypothetical protein